jgi:hypothetical protein
MERYGTPIKESASGYKVVPVLVPDENGYEQIIAYAVLDPDGNELSRWNDRDDALTELENIAGPEPRGPSGPGM